MIYDVAIVGGGVAGLFCSCILAEKYPEKKSILIEKNKSLGKKMLLSGAGQCNYTNAEPILEMIQHYGDKKNFVKHAMKQWTNKDMMDYFEKIGIPSIINENNKVFPKSLDAKTILEGLLNQVENKVKIDTNNQVRAIEKTTICHENVFKILSEKQTIIARRVVIASGGCSYPQTGSTGDGYHLAEAMGHHIVPLKPGLTGVEVQNSPFASLKGISFRSIKVTHILKENHQVKEYQGDLLLTPFGLSGPVIINNSRNMAQGDKILIHFIDKSFKEAEKAFIGYAEENGKMLFSAYMNTMGLPKRLRDVLMSKTSIDGQKRISEISKKERKQMLEVLTAFPVQIYKLKGFKSAMVTVGGVDTNEINKKTMASTIVEGLYFIGEVIDIDGDTGGYNIQFAFSSAYAAAIDLGQS